MYDVAVTKVQYIQDQSNVHYNMIGQLDMKQYPRKKNKQIKKIYQGICVTVLSLVFR
jgi:hypothetical protein